MVQLYNTVSFKISKLVTRTYSTSFSIAVSFLDSEMQDAIYSIYGFVRFADEIVDSFENCDKKQLLEKFEGDYYEAFNSGLSLNPILHSFQQIVKTYKIPDEFIQSFLKSMKVDLYKSDFKNKAEIDEYIYGSADVVGLMCLKVFTNGNEKLFNELQYPAMKLGSAFQKVNFLRDLRNDVEHLNRRYFPGIGKSTFNEDTKSDIIQDIKNDFYSSYLGIRKLPGNAKLPVLIAFFYYKRLLRKIKKTPAERLFTTRIRVSDFKKFLLLIKAVVVCKCRLI
jgi:15-cis-phytoene synthase